MKKRWFISGILVLVLVTVSSVYVFSNKNENLLTTEQLPSVITNSVAALYFSTTADQDMNRDGLSFAVFINKEGQTDVFEMDGLELGTIHGNDESFFLEDRSHVHVVDAKGTKTFVIEGEEHTGEVTGFRNGMYYSVYNSGFNGEGGYSSNIRVGNKDGFKTIKIPYYLHMSGITEDELMMVAGEEDNISLFTMPLQDSVQIEEVVPLGKVGDRLGLSPIVKADGAYFMLISDTQKLTSELYRIDGQSKTVEMFPFLTYKDAEDYRIRVPYNLRNAAAVIDDTFYYVDGVGEVHSIHVETGETGLAFSLEGASTGSLKMSEQTYFQDGKLHFFRYDKATIEHTIDTYDVQTGKKVSTLPVHGLADMFDYTNKKNKRISPYDFIVFDK